jgi:hypothetical protein
MMKQALGLIAPFNWRFWLLLGLVVKSMQIVVMLPTLPNLNAGGNPLVHYAGDSFAYLEFAENFIQHGEFFISNETVYDKAIMNIEYAEDEEYLNSRNHTFRMPGYASFIMIPMFFFDTQEALTLVVIAQVILNVISIYLLSLLLFKVTESKVAYTGLFLLLSGSFYVSKWSVFIMAEAASISFLIIVLYLTLGMDKRASTRNYILAGILGSWAIFMRPFFAPFIALIGLVLLYHFLKGRLDLKRLLAFILPIIIIQTSWVARNLSHTSKFVLFEDTNTMLDNGNTTWNSWVEYTRSCGEYWAYWDTDCMGAWILPQQYFINQGVDPPTNEVLPPHILSDSVLLSELEFIKSNFSSSLISDLPLSERILIDQKATASIDNIRAQHIRNNWFRAHIYNRFRILIKFINQPLDVALRALSYPVNVVFTFLQASANHLIGWFGVFLAGLLILRPKRMDDPLVLISAFIPLFMILLMVGYKQSSEARLFTTGYSFLAFSVFSFLFDKRNSTALKIAGCLIVSVVSALAGIYHVSMYLYV